MKAIYASKRCQAIKADKLFDDFKAGHADRATRSRIQSLSSLDLLLIEELGYIEALEPRQVNDFSD